MKHKCNKRTLKKRVRKVMSICIFLSIVLFGVIMVYISARTSFEESKTISSYFSNYLTSSINSTYFLKQMNIKELKDFKPNTPMAKEWYKSLKASINSNSNLETMHNASDFSELFGSKKMIFSEIKINDKIFYSNLINNKQSLKGLERFFDTESVSTIKDSNHKVVVTVTVKVNADYPIFALMIIIFFVFFIGLLLLIVINFISKFLTLPITIPIKQLEEKSRAIAVGNYEGSIDTQIVLKRPLKEIESLANSTNLIIQKNKEYNDLLEKQKVILENQNEELEAQNLELAESKKRIEEAQTMLVQSENMASVGQLTAAITHEINTPLGAINSNVQMYEMLLESISGCRDLISDDETKEILSQMKETNHINLLACQRVTEIIRSLKNFTRLDQAEFQVADVNEGIRSVLILTSNLWKKKITLHEEYGNIMQIKCFPGLLNQVFMNIIVNAIQSIEGNGEIFIKTSQDGDKVFVSIKDTGSGISEENLSKIFDYGYSTKRAGVGAGLGLSICKNIIDKHNGEIKVISKLGEGTAFVIVLPINN